jgi:hypothetical protein
MPDELRKGDDDPQQRAELERRAGPVVKLQHLPVACGDGSNRRQLFITINGRQALHEGPRKAGQR